MADTIIAGGASGDTGSLGSDTLAEVKKGRVELSTDGGTTYMERGVGEPVVFSSGLTLHYRNSRPNEAILHTKAI